MTWLEPELLDGVEALDCPLEDELPDDLVRSADVVPPDLAAVELPELAEPLVLELAGWEVLVFAGVVLAEPGRL